MLYRFLIIVICLLWAGRQDSWAQFSLAPNHTPYKTNVLPTNKGEKDTPLTLPFFDDFSNYTGSPNQKLWVVPSGVLVNQSFGTEPISVGVATFDGLKADGSPYSFSNVVVDAVGVSDTLASKPINLASQTNALYLSFYWQAEGQGERPDATDSLYVEFLDNTNTWNYVWGQRGGQPTKPFKAALIPVNESRYFHDKFQFRILSYGRLSGMYDAWHLDYIYLNKNRTATDTLVEDVTTSRITNSFLKKYRAMPLKQYFANPIQETSADLRGTLNNLSGSVGDTGFDVINYKMIVEDALTNTLLVDLGSPTSTFAFGNTQRQFAISRTIPTNPLASTHIPLAVRSKIIVETGNELISMPPINLNINDTITCLNMLSDYFAYDDGSAEYGAGINQRFGKVAIKFKLNAPDTLTDIRFHLTKFEKDLTGQTFNLIIWQGLVVPPLNKDSIRYKLVVPIRYPSTRDTLLSVESVRKQIDPTFKFPLISLPAGEFYIGWEQTNNDRLTFGYDRNTNSSSEIFYNVGNQWSNWEPQTDETGSLLLRPVFSDDYLTANEADWTTSPFQIFPNPATTDLHIKGSLPKTIELLDLQGRVRATHHIQRQDAQTTISIAHLPAGLYLLRGIFTNGKSFVKKIVVQK